MCGRFGLWAPQPDLERRFGVEVGFDYEPRYNVAPEGGGIGVVRGASPDRLDRLAWGLLPPWVEDPEGFPTLINARAETVEEKPAFREAVAERRCLVPASAFYEWTGRGDRRIPHAFGVDDEPTFSMAGLWERWTAGGDTRLTAAILTTEANAVVEEVHGRMPVILDRADERRWLEADDPAERRSLLAPFDADRTTGYEVSPALNDPTNDGPSLVDPVASQQTDLGEF